MESETDYGLNGKLEKEFELLWQEFRKYKEKHRQKQKLFEDIVAQFLFEKSQSVVWEAYERAVEMLMITDFGIYLGARKNEALAKRILPCSVIIIDSEDEELSKANFKIGVVKREQEDNFELWVSEEMLFDEIPYSSGPLGEVRQRSKLMTNNEFVLRVLGGIEEYAHMAYGSVKKEEVVAGNKGFQEFIEETMESIDDPWLTDVLYHSTDIEFRGLIWKVWLLRTYLPSYKSINSLRQEDARVVRNILMGL